MKDLWAAATIAAFLAAAPASAQVAYGMSPGENASASAGGNWRNAVVIYAETPDSILLDRLVAPLGDDGVATSFDTGGAVSFDVQGSNGSAGLTGFSGTTDATSPVPEPATWATMLLGFGAVGGALRSRRKAALRYA